jgi:hypothetical protein
MTARDLLNIWRQAQAAPDFYVAFEAKTGLTKDVVIKHFNTWNGLPYAEAQAIADRQGVSLKDGGFQAIWVPGILEPPGSVPPEYCGRHQPKSEP